VTVQQKLGIYHGFAFDVHAVCSGFVYAMTTADAYLRSGMSKRCW
jgi:3-oxoacyl-[acyl-carrier-protein] synthase-3